jgi:hypothetical protein
MIQCRGLTFSVADIDVDKPPAELAPVHFKNDMEIAQMIHGKGHLGFKTCILVQGQNSFHCAENYRSKSNK